MKKLNLLAIMVLLFVSCQKDDDIFVPQCETPVNLSASDVTYNSATLTWTDNSELTASSLYEIEYGISGFVAGSGITATSASTSLSISNLLPNTAYAFYVQKICNTDNISIASDFGSFTTLAPPVVAEFRQNLSELNLFQGNLMDLQPSIYTFLYRLNSTLYSDYSLKQRIVALPLGASMTYLNDGLPNFPDNTVIAKTFYYNLDDRNLSLGKKIIETRVMIKINGTWEFGDYIWNESQSEASLDNNGSVVPVSWIDNDGADRSVNYQIPSVEDCFTCHQNNRNSTLIGPKLRSMNFNINGANQLQNFINNGQLVNAPDVSTIGQLPNWEDTTQSDEQRVRAYFDMNCAHCHSAGGYHTLNYFDALNVAYETRFADSHIFNERYSIIARMQTSVDGYSMPFLGVSTPHQEALDLIVPYLESLE
jgi:uncharacterized repeat protein (TIGR03806 family)